MRRRKTKNDLHIHAKRRAFQRYGIILTKTLRQRIINIIQSGDRNRFTPVRKQSLTRTVFDVPLDGKTFRVVYDTKRHAIATFLSLDMHP